MSEETAAFQGTVKWFNAQKGYGFIIRDGGPDVFVHHSEIVMEGYRTLREGEVVSYELRDSAKGPIAVKVVRVTTPQDDNQSKPT